MKQILLLLSLLTLGGAALCAQPRDTTAPYVIRHWLLEANAAATLYGPILDRAYSGFAIPWWSLRAGTRLTREIFVVGGIDHYSENRRSSGPCPPDLFPCEAEFVDEFRLDALSVGVRITVARSPNADLFVGGAIGSAWIRRYDARLVKLVLPTEIGLLGWVERSQQLQWGPSLVGRIIFGMDEQWRVGAGDLITDPVLVGIGVGLFARW